MDLFHMRVYVLHWNCYLNKTWASMWGPVYMTFTHSLHVINEILSAYYLYLVKSAFVSHWGLSRMLRTQYWEKDTRSLLAEVPKHSMCQCPSLLAGGLGDALLQDSNAVLSCLGDDSLLRAIAWRTRESSAIWVTWKKNPLYPIPRKELSISTIGFSTGSSTYQTQRTVALFGIKSPLIKYYANLIIAVAIWTAAMP